MNEILIEADRLESQGNPLGRALRFSRAIDTHGGNSYGYYGDGWGDGCSGYGGGDGCGGDHNGYGGGDGYGNGNGKGGGIGSGFDNGYGDGSGFSGGYGRGLIC